jgi:hypothetical protein
MKKDDPIWKNALSIKGIYLIMDTKTGKRYVGKADGEHGIWQRWGDYICDGHGGDVDLRRLVDEKGMDYIKDVNEMWYESLTSNGIDSLVLFRLKSNDNQIGYMWVSNFEATDTPKIKETLEITTFILGFEIGNHLLVDQLTASA